VPPKKKKKRIHHPFPSGLQSVAEVSADNLQKAYLYVINHFALVAFKVCNWLFILFDYNVLLWFSLDFPSWGSWSFLN
jgi:hypothetical protein